MKKIAKSVKIFSNKIIKNKKGNIIKFLSRKDKFYKGFGDIYFSEIKRNKIKGWNLHKKNTCTIVVPEGTVNFKIFDPKKKKLIKISIGKKNNKILQIPPGIWFSFTTESKKAIVTNLMDKPHRKKETIKESSINGIKIK